MLQNRQLRPLTGFQLGTAGQFPASGWEGVASGAWPREGGSQVVPSVPWEVPLEAVPSLQGPGSPRFLT